MSTCADKHLSSQHTFADFSRILSNATYFDGNASEYDWVVNSGSIINTNSSGGELAMILTESNGGTRLSSTRYVHYGKITTRRTYCFSISLRLDETTNADHSTTVKSGRWGGVVTAFITMSDIKDEIDWEFPATPTDGGISGNLTDTFSNYHDYSIDWQPDSLTWLIDEQPVRTLTRSSVTDNSTGISRYPSTPSRIQLSIWPAGINSSAQGTIQWAGGLINWNDPDYQAAGTHVLPSPFSHCLNHHHLLFRPFLRARVFRICHLQRSNNPAANVTSYVYGTNASAFDPTISFSNVTTVSGAVGGADIRALSTAWTVLAAAAVLMLGAGFV
ncbi:putative glycosidase crf2 [Grifola frondosa]|uniref:Putative glycosidase crf2 n=1 Tax=Grifola frondosa TaxID=5627 RepID=A0A1C7LS20_GRIFR|nr:putative glycosidase crf2 [Grifola frondosa]